MPNAPAEMSVPSCRLAVMDEISTLISSGTAVVATAVSLFLLRQGQVDRRKLAEDAEREQARQVSA